MNFISRAGCAAAAIALTSCSFSQEIVIDGLETLQPAFRFERQGLLQYFGSPAPLTNFQVVQMRDGAWDYKDPVWAFSLQPGGALDVERVRYGQTNAGFGQTLAPKPLVRSIPYLALASGPGWGASKQFVLR
jgi:hypothetical protein